MQSTPRAGTKTCQPCRDAKVKCDRMRPTCTRCSRQGIQCHGYSDDIFRDQNIPAANAVQRSKRSPIGEVSAQDSPIPAPNEHGQNSTPWLKPDVRMPRHLYRDLDSRIVDSFFQNWVMHPCNHNVSPGHLQDLPQIYHNSLPGTSARLAIEALAYADAPGYAVKARARYGAALQRIRDVIGDAERVKRDAVLAALLIIDNYELMHHNRSEPLGPHSTGLVYLLHVRGDDQFFVPQSFSLWRVAHHRLQARQILLREMPYPEQEIWISKLNDRQPDLHITTHVYQISKLCAEAQELINDPTRDIQAFLVQVARLTRDCEDWAADLPMQWKANKIKNETSFALEDVSIHHDIWLAYMLNFHNASRICVKEAYLDVITRRQAPESDQDVQETTDVIAEMAISLLGTMPQLLGLVDFQGQPRRSEFDVTGSKVGKGIGGFFAIYSLFAIRACKYTKQQHKKVAEELWSWIHNRNEQL